MKNFFKIHKHKYQIAVFLVILGLVVSPTFGQAGYYSLKEIVTGRTLLTVDKGGEAWYVWPKDARRYYLGSGQTVMETINKVVVPISNSDLAKIKIGIIQIPGFEDTDGDGLWNGLEQALDMSRFNADTDGDSWPDGEEIANNYNPSGVGKLPFDLKTSQKYSGYILLQYQNHGEAWYVWPPDNKRYYLGTNDQAFKILTKLALGITQVNLNRIAVGYSPLPKEVALSQTVNVLLGEYLMYLEEKDIIIKRGTDLKIVFNNKGNYTHRFEIKKLGATTDYIASGQSYSLTIPASDFQTGTYVITEFSDTGGTKILTLSFNLQLKN
jgi:hypothetical protein